MKRIFFLNTKNLREVYMVQKHSSISMVQHQDLVCHPIIDILSLLVVCKQECVLRQVLIVTFIDFVLFRILQCGELLHQEQLFLVTGVST